MDVNRRKRTQIAPLAPPAGPTAVPIGLLKTVIDWDSQMVAVLDRELRYIAVNAVWTAALRLREEEALGRTPMEVLGARGRVVERELRTALAGRQAVKTYEAPDDGGLRHMMVSPWRDEAGEICGVIVRHEAEEGFRRRPGRRERRLTLAMEMARITAYEIDFRTGTTVFEPPRTDEPQPVGIHSIEDMLSRVPESQQQAQREAWDRHFADGELLIQEFPRCKPDGQVVWQLAASEAVYNAANEVIGIVGMTQNIDERKRAELALVAEKEAAQAADRAKSEFLANISHEIRTPLNGVLGLASLLTRADLDPLHHEMAETIETSAQTLNALLSDVLDLAKVEAGRLELAAQPFDPAEVVAHLHNLLAAAAAEKNLQFICDIDPSLRGLALGDRTRLSQILTNLCSNAIKFTSSGWVKVHGRADGEGDQRQLIFTISDSGIGISQDALDRLFERFVQADGSISRSFGGSGLGLAISRSLARMMGGDVDVVSEPGVGSTFTVTLRAPRWSGSLDEQPTQAVSAVQALSGGRPPRVLLVEDHPVNRRVVELILADLVSLEIAENGAEGFAAFKARAFDVVLMDMQMPVMDGLEATREIRAFERAAGRAPTPIIMLSANALGEHVRAGQEAGADFHLAKPVTADGLVAALGRALETPRALVQTAAAI